MIWWGLGRGGGVGKGGLMGTGLELEAKQTRREESKTVDIIYKKLHPQGASKPQNTNGWGKPPTATRPGGIRRKKEAWSICWTPAATPWKSARAQGREVGAEKGHAHTSSGAPGA